MTTPDKPSAVRRFWALLRQRCPNCFEGDIYKHGMTMHKRCPTCNVLFEREPGYFMGSLYISYALASVILLAGMVIGHQLMPTVDLVWISLMSGAAFIPLVPTVTRYARVIWMYFDHWAWPAHDSEAGTPPPKP